MTPPSRSSAWALLDRWASRVIIVCAVVTGVNFVGLAIALILISDQAGEGASARDRQQAVYPVSLKLYEAAERRGEITFADLACFKASGDCPKRPNK